MKKLIIIEGLDGSGKSTQVKLLEDYFTKNSIDYKKIKLPDYDSPSSTLVKMYLGGEFGKSADDVNAYAAGAFYAVCSTGTDIYRLIFQDLRMLYDI